MSETAVSRMARYTERQRAKGLVRVSVWASPEAADEIKAIAAESVYAVEDVNSKARISAVDEKVKAALSRSQALLEELQGKFPGHFGHIGPFGRGEDA